ncbi:MAG TPA: sigma-70 family RNA polymerase sigma factor [Planctomycetes bacterium]|nr:sigma-70 family RNA polymerase sigma factor [Fuerstiella sp.]HIK93762.1 sigma-70 family RNA polymerase sigma factor [Planctomycetota bacterium]
MSNSELQFVQLLTSHQARLYAYVLSLVADADQANDIMQETNTVLWVKSSDFEIGTNFSAWMRKTAYFQVMAYRKKLARECVVFDDLLVGQLAEAASERDETMEGRRDLVRQCLSQMNDRHRELIRSRYQDGFALADIAAAMNRKTNAIKQSLFRARTILIECVRNKTLEVKQ